MTTPLSPPLEEWVFLSGRPPMSEYLGFVTSSAADEASVNIQTLSNEWRAANNHIRNLETNEAGWADGPTIGEIPDALKAFAELVKTDPMFKRAFEIVPTSI